MKEYVGNMKEYVENMKKYVGIWGKYEEMCGKYEGIRGNMWLDLEVRLVVYTFLHIIEALGLEKNSELSPYRMWDLEPPHV